MPQRYTKKPEATLNPLCEGLSSFEALYEAAWIFGFLSRRFGAPKIIILLVLASITCQSTTAQDFNRSEDVAGIDHLQRGNGVAVADYDQDGDLDIFMVAHPSFDPLDEITWNRFFENNGDGTFDDVTIQAGFDEQYVNTGDPATTGEKMGVAWGDYDNDGFPDLFLTNSREDQLYHNQGDGTFVDVTEQAGVAGCNDCYSSSGLWWDPDIDGDLDLYVSNLKGANTMFQNQGDGSFVDITEQSGLAGFGITWASVPLDVGKEGFLDLYTINDTQENQFFENREVDISFNEASQAYRLNDEGAGMGVTIGDYNNDGLFDIYLTNIFNHHPNPLYTNLGTRRFQDDAAEMGVADTGWGWGTKFFDCDHDGDEDLYAVNGVEQKAYIEGVEQQDVSNFFFKNQLMEGTEGFSDWSVASGTNGEAKSRGLEVFDYDDDGDLDLVVANILESSFLYRNELIKESQPESANWIKIWLEGTTSNRDAIGTEVKVTLNGVSFYRWHHGAGFLSQSLKPVHFGLGSAQVIDKIQITWPGGEVEAVYNVPVNQTMRLMEGDNPIVTGMDDDLAEHHFEVYNYPNPYKSSTTLHLKLIKPGSLDLRIYSITGKELYKLNQQVLESGSIDLMWTGVDNDGNSLGAGIYFYTASFENDRVHGKMVKLD